MSHPLSASSRCTVVAFAALAALIAACGSSTDPDPGPDSDTPFAGITLANPTGSSGISATGLVAAYDFETYTGGGELMDFGPFGHHGAVARTQATSGQFGGARLFTGEEDVVDLPEVASLALEGPLTIAAWIRLSTSGQHQHILSCDDLYVLWTTTANQYRLADTQANGVTTGAGTVQFGSWHSLIGVLDATRGDALNASNIKIYVDGAPLSGTREATWAPGAGLISPEACLIGAAISTATHPAGVMTGALDEMLVFSRALSEDEIEAFATKAP